MFVYTHTFVLYIRVCIHVTRLFSQHPIFWSLSFIRELIALTGLGIKALLFFVSRLLGPRVCGRQEKKKRKKKHTEHERVQFLGTTEHERGPYTHATRRKTYWTREGAVLSTTEHERVPYTHATRCTRRYKSTYTHWNNVIHYTKMYNYPSHADVRFGTFRCMY